VEVQTASKQSTGQFTSLYVPSYSTSLILWVKWESLWRTARRDSSVCCLQVSQ